MFFVGIIPAPFTLWIRRNLEEPEMWRRSRRAGVGNVASGFSRVWAYGSTREPMFQLVLE